jgi:predicted acylesterase/phospholipase RssA
MHARRLSALVPLALLTLATSSCNWIVNRVRSEDVLAKMNAKSVLVPPPDTTEEIAFIYSRALTDAYWKYWTPKGTEPFACDKATDALSQAVWCAGTKLVNRSIASSPQGIDECMEVLYKQFDFAPTDPSTDITTDPGQAEEDIIRLETRLAESVITATAYLRTNHPEYFRNSGGSGSTPPSEWSAVKDGIHNGLAQFTTYQKNHGAIVKRDMKKPPTALVLSGGSANGAFSAGGVWWLLTQLTMCPTCQDHDTINIVAGASTGSLIAVLVKDFFAQGAEHHAAALRKLTDNYLCSTNADLYCVTDAGAADLGLTGNETGETGLVRFTGISKLLNNFIDQSTFAAPVELFASTTEYRTGRLFHLSSSDAADIPDLPALRQAILSSIVEPGMSEPIYHVGPRSGFFIDGGIRSGLPMLGPLRGGAERVVAFVNEESDMIPFAKPPGTALSALFRSIDLMTFQPIIGELNQGEYEVAVRRTAEYERCLKRFPSPAVQKPPTDNKAASMTTRATSDSTPTLSPDYAKRERFCRFLKPLPTGNAERAEVVPVGPPQLRLLEQLYRSAWVFQPRVVPQEFKDQVGDLTSLNSAGYEFEPNNMWKQFVLGAATVQERCEELRWALGWTISCKKTEDLKNALAALHADVTQRGCYQKKNDVKVCGKEDPPISVP